MINKYKLVGPISDGVPLGVIAKDSDHAISFLRSLLSITEVTELVEEKP